MQDSLSGKFNAKMIFYLDKVAEYKSGKGANPARVNELLKEKLQ